MTKNPRIDLKFTWKQLNLIGNVMLVYSWRADVPMSRTRMAGEICKSIRKAQLAFQKAHRTEANHGDKQG